MFRFAGRAALVLAIGVLAGNVAAQEAIDTSPSGDVVVLDDSLEKWVDSSYWAGALCYETVGQLINEHAVFTDPNRLANAQNLHDVLGELLGARRGDMFAKGLTFEQSLAIDSYFYGFTQPKTARYVLTKQASDLAIDLRRCPAAVQALQLQVNDAPQ